MSSSDVRMLDELTERVAALEAVSHAPVAVVSREEYEAVVARVEGLETTLSAFSKGLGELHELVVGKDMSAELYGAIPDHAADRAERGRLALRGQRLRGDRRVPREVEKAADLIIPDEVA